MGDSTEVKARGDVREVGDKKRRGLEMILEGGTEERKREAKGVIKGVGKRQKMG